MFLEVDQNTIDCFQELIKILHSNKDLYFQIVT